MDVLVDAKFDSSDLPDFRRLFWKPDFYEKIAVCYWFAVLEQHVFS